MFPRLTPFYDGLMLNRDNWNRLAQNASMVEPASKDEKKPTMSISHVISVKASGDKPANRLHNSKRSPRSPRRHRSPLTTRKSPLTSRKLSDPPVSPGFSRSVYITHITPKSPLSSRGGHVTGGKSKNLTHINGLGALRGGPYSPVGIISYSLYIVCFLVFLDV